MWLAYVPACVFPLPPIRQSFRMRLLHVQCMLYRSNCVEKKRVVLHAQLKNKRWQEARPQLEMCIPGGTLTTDAGGVKQIGRFLLAGYTYRRCYVLSSLLHAPTFLSAGGSRFAPEICKTE